MEKVLDRLVDAVDVANDDPGFLIEVVVGGIRIKYTFEKDRKIYTTENITNWGAIARAEANPLLLAMNDLLKQAAEF